MGRFLRAISAFFSKLAYAFKRIFYPRLPSTNQQAGGVQALPQPPMAEAGGGGAESPNQEHMETSGDSAPAGSEILLGALQTMIATPASPMESSEQAEGGQGEAAPPSAGGGMEAEGGREERVYVPKIKPKPSPPLPREHRLLVRKLVRAGKRKEAAAQLEELGYLFPEVFTRGKYIIVQYRGRDGYLYAARIKYKA